MCISTNIDAQETCINTYIQTLTHTHIFAHSCNTRIHTRTQTCFFLFFSSASYSFCSVWSNYLLRAIFALCWFLDTAVLLGKHVYGGVAATTWVSRADNMTSRVTVSNDGCYALATTSVSTGLGRYNCYSYSSSLTIINLPFLFEVWYTLCMRSSCGFFSGLLVVKGLCRKLVYTHTKNSQ